MRRWRHAAALLLLAAGWAHSAVAADKPAGKDQQKDPPGIVRMSADAQKGAGLKTAPAVRRRVTEPIQAPGTILFDERHVARLRSFAQGRVLRLLVRPGDQVAVGQPLAELDIPGLTDARDSLAAAQAAVRQAQAEVQVAVASQRRGEMLARDGSVARAEAERRGAETARARAAADTARAQVAANEARVARLSPAPGGSPGTGMLASPIAGVVVTVGVTPGEVVDPATEAFTVADLSVMLVLMQVAEKDVPQVRVGDAAMVRLTTGPDRTWRGRVASVGAELDPRTRTLPARVELANADGALRAGLFVQVQVTSDQGRSSTEIPAAALQTVDDKPIAFVRAGPDRFERRDLQLGVQRPDWVEVRAGLHEGEEVVTDGAFALKSILQKDLLGSTD